MHWLLQQDNIVHISMPPPPGKAAQLQHLQQALNTGDCCAAHTYCYSTQEGDYVHVHAHVWMQLHTHFIIILQVLTANARYQLGVSYLNSERQHVHTS